MSDSSDEDETTEHRKQSSLTNQQNSKQIVIKQNVKNPVRKGPYAIKRKLDPNAVAIQRRFVKKYSSINIKREGSRPIFDRDDVRVNPSPPKSAQKNLQKKKSVSPNPSLDRYGKNNRKTYSSNPRRDRSYSPKQKRTPEKKVPYFIDPVRERDRIKAKDKRQRDPTRSRSRSKTRHRSRTRSRSPSSRSRRRRRSRSRSYHRSYSRHRSPSRERHRKRRSRSRSHSPSRSRSRRTSTYENTPQFIPVPAIPVPVEYAAAPPPRWMPPAIYPRYPMMPRPPMYPPLVPYYPGLGAPIPPPLRNNYPRYRGRPNRNYNNRSGA